MELMADSLKMNQMVKNEINPWKVSSIFDFNFFCCPECDRKSQNKQDFVDHASTYHAWVSLKSGETFGDEFWV